MNYEIVWVPIFITFAAGTLAMLQIKSNNITNARLKWLENFKQILTDFTSESKAIQMKIGVDLGISGMGNSIISETIFEQLKFIESKHQLIILNLNPKEDLHLKLETLLDDYMELFNEMPGQERIEDYNALILKMEKCSKTLNLLVRFIIKLEWERTKRTFLSRKWYMKFGKGKGILIEAKSL